MSLATFLPDNRILNSTLSLLVGTVNSQFPLDNIKHDFSTKVFRSNENHVTLLIDLGSSQQVDMISIRGNFLSGLGFNSATIIGSATLVFTGTPTDLAISQKHSMAFVELPLQSLRYWKLDLIGTTLVEVANLFLGKKVQMLDNNISQGFSYTQNTLSAVSKNTYGQRFIDTYGTQKVITGEIKLCNDTEFSQINDIQIANGENVPLWFFLDVKGDIGTETEYLYAGMFYLNDLVWKQVTVGLQDCQIVLTECL